MHEIRLQHLSVRSQHNEKGELLTSIIITISVMASSGYRLNLYVSQVNNRKYPKLKEVDDVLGGAAAWENVDSTAGGLHTRVKSSKARFVCAAGLC